MTAALLSQLFMLAIGVKVEGLRFRQHLPTEMAHYGELDLALFLCAPRVVSL